MSGLKNEACGETLRKLCELPAWVKHEGRLSNPERRQLRERRLRAVAGARRGSASQAMAR
jgi:hypothetical protein